MYLTMILIVVGRYLFTVLPRQSDRGHILWNINYNGMDSPML